MLLFFVVLALFESILAAPCGYEHITIIKNVRGDKEYAYVDAQLDIQDASTWCEGQYMGSEEIGFPFGKLLRPTQDELLWVIDNLLPDPLTKFHTGYWEYYGQHEDTPEAYGITKDKYGSDHDKHWVEGHPHYQIGVIYVTDKRRFDPETQQRLPLLASNYLASVLPFVCVRKVTEEFPANMGYFDKEYECDKVAARTTYGSSRELVYIDEKSTFDEAYAICDNLESEGFPDGYIKILDTNSAYYVKRAFAEDLDFWSAHKYSSRYNGYVDVYTSEDKLDYDDWDYRQPGGGDCVVGTWADEFPFGGMETSFCDDKHVFACERRVKKVKDTIIREFNGKQLTYFNKRVLWYDADDACKALGSQLFRPTADELAFMTKELPGLFPFWLGYDMEWEDYEGVYNPEAYGITADKYGTSMRQWVRDPFCIGAISTTTEIRQEIPLLVCSYFSDYRSYICEKDLEGTTRTGSNEPEDNPKSSGLLVLAAFGSVLTALVALSFFIFRKNRTIVSEEEDNTL